MSGLDPAKRRRMAWTAGIVVAVVCGMTGLAFAAGPIYSTFCRVTGYGGTTQTATAAPTRMLDRTIDVQFDANVAPGLPIEFAPEQRHQTLRLGETGLAFYRVHNTSDQPVTAIASYNVAPHKVGIYFQKLECFCFQEQVIGPGQTADLPVVYYVDPDLATDRDTEEVREVTLSYTFFASADAAASALE
jgi:cytochrome c oxidase assembly protein subunit 11